MDSNGDFVIAWASFGQVLSYSNFVDFQRYDRFGSRVGGETPGQSARFKGYTSNRRST